MIIKLKSVEEIKKLMIIKGFSQRSLAEKLNLSDTHVNHVVNGLKNPGPVTAKKICDALEVEFKDIFFIDDDNKSYHKNLA